MNSVDRIKGSIRVSKSAIFIVLLGIIASPCAVASSDDLIIVPGISFGPITKETPVSELPILFKDALVYHSDHTEDDLTEKNIPNKAMVYVIWGEGKNKHNPIYYGLKIFLDNKQTICVVVGFSMSRTPKWRTSEGIAFGTPISVVHKMNGRPFPLEGYRGGLMNWGWNNGKLSPSLILHFSFPKEKLAGAAHQWKSDLLSRKSKTHVVSIGTTIGKIGNRGCNWLES